MVERLLATHAPAGSMAELTTGVQGNLQSGFDRDPEGMIPFRARVLRAARELLETLLGGVAAGDVEACEQGASRLAGLGGGLTPAGDDFLLVVFYALFASRPQRQAAALAQAMVSSAAHRTSRLSAAWLSAGARGEASQPWHDLIAALALPDGQALVAAVQGVLGVGHTSGADALAGFVLGLRRD
jgi:hypothetical protein